MRPRRHAPPIPDPDAHPLKYMLAALRWRLAVAAAVYPVQIAVTLAMVVCAVPVYLVLESQATLRDQAATQAKQQTQIKRLVGGIQASRVKVTGDICRVLDRNTKITNAQLSLFQGLIVSGAKQSIIFEPLYRQYGAPGYAKRLKQAQEAAQGIEHLRLPLPNCTAAILTVKVPLPPPPPTVAHGNP